MIVSGEFYGFSVEFNQGGQFQGFCIEYRENVYVTVIDGDGAPIDAIEVTINYDGQEFTELTDVNGNAKFIVPPVKLGVTLVAGGGCITPLVETFDVLEGSTHVYTLTALAPPCIDKKPVNTNNVYRWQLAQNIDYPLSAFPDLCNGCGEVTTSHDNNGVFPNQYSVRSCPPYANLIIEGEKYEFVINEFVDTTIITESQPATIALIRPDGFTVADAIGVAQLTAPDINGRRYVYGDFTAPKVLQGCPYFVVIYNPLTMKVFAISQGMEGGIMSDLCRSAYFEYSAQNRFSGYPYEVLPLEFSTKFRLATNEIEDVQQISLTRNKEATTGKSIPLDAEIDEVSTFEVSKTSKEDRRGINTAIRHNDLIVNGVNMAVDEGITGDRESKGAQFKPVTFTLFNQDYASRDLMGDM